MPTETTPTETTPTETTPQGGTARKVPASTHTQASPRKATWHGRGNHLPARNHKRLTCASKFWDCHYTAGSNRSTSNGPLLLAFSIWELVPRRYITSAVAVGNEQAGSFNPFPIARCSVPVFQCYEYSKQFHIIPPKRKSAPSGWGWGWESQISLGKCPATTAFKVINMATPKQGRRRVQRERCPRGVTKREL